MARNPDWFLFNKIFESYDKLKFQKEPCDRLIAHASVSAQEKVLDVACGTGWATLAAAHAVGPTGCVIGIDIADKALEIARGKALKAGLGNVSFEEQDGHHPRFEDGTFDVVTCASALFGFQDIPGALREWKRILRPRGRVAICTYGREFRSVSTMLRNTIAKYLTASSARNANEGSLETIEECTNQLAEAGFNNIQTATEELGYYYPTLDAYWEEDVMSSMRRIPLDKLDRETAERVRIEHFQEMKAFARDQGIWRPVPTLFAVGLKPN
jgi:ubiquinone/menaquinone biosynthesis C-methylase UbiE